MLGNVVLGGLDADRSMKALGRLDETAITLKKRAGVGVARDIFTVSLPRLFSDLTEKQLLALLEALDNGYCKVPRTVTTGRLSEAKGVPRTTCKEHIRKAESKVLQSVHPFLRHYTGG